MKFAMNLVQTAVMLIGLPLVLLWVIAHAVIAALLAFAWQVLDVWE